MTLQWRRNHGGSGGSGGWSPRRILVVKLCSVERRPSCQLRGVVAHVLKVCIYWSTVVEVCRVHSIMKLKERNFKRICVSTQGE